jgi:drug/metabolite transporter (DMT)-like permease
MALSAFAAQVLMTEAYGALSVGEAAAWLQFTPIAQYLLAAALLGEAVTPVGMVGIAVSVAGVAWATRLGQRAAATPPPG